MSINIIYLGYRRFKFAELTFLSLSKSKYKSNVHVTIPHFDLSKERANNTLNLVNSLGIKASLLNVGTAKHNYINKIHKCASMFDKFEYSIKMDEDCFIGPNSWDVFLSNLNILDKSDDNIILAPALSTGIPSCDYFIEHHMDNIQKQEIYNIFSKTKIRGFWGVGNKYDHLKQVLDAGYNQKKYYEAIRKINHYYKGIHPIRVNLAAVEYINNFISNNTEKYLGTPSIIEVMNEPYFCNSFFAIKTKLWHKIVNSKNLFRDGFDEVPLNLYREKNNGKFWFIKDCFGVHTLYNTLNGAMGVPDEKTNQIEENIVQKLLKKL